MINNNGIYSNLKISQLMNTSFYKWSRFKYRNTFDKDKKNCRLFNNTKYNIHTIFNFNN